MAQRLEMVVLRAPRSVRHAPTSLPLGSPEAPPMRMGADDLPPAPAAGRTVSFAELSISHEDLTLEEVRDLDRDEEVIGVAPEMPVVLVEPVADSAAANDSRPPVSWGIEAVGAAKGPDAGAGVVVAVLDTGIDNTHPAFAGMTLVEKNFTTESGADINGHGTHCAGTIFGRDVNGTRIGVARAVDKALIAKVLGAGGSTTETVYRAMLWAMSEGAHIISMSLGIDFPGFQKYLVDQGYVPQHATSVALAGYRANVRLFDAMSRMVTVPDGVIGGAIVVAAAGNESNRPDYAVTVAPPAAGEQFMSVAALKRGNDPTMAFGVARFSNEEAGFAAPGVDIWSAWPGGGLVALSGTSMATPHVAGVAALWAQQPVAQNRFRARDVIQLMTGGVDSLAYLARRDIGAGMPVAP